MSNPQHPPATLKHDPADVELVANYLADCVEQEPNEYFNAMATVVVEILNLPARIEAAKRAGWEGALSLIGRTVANAEYDSDLVPKMDGEDDD